MSSTLSTVPPRAPVEPEPAEEPEPQSLVRDKLIELQASLPDKLDVSKEAFEQFLLNLSLCHKPIAFELLGTHKRITVQFAGATDDAPLVRRQLAAYFPEATFQTQEGTLENTWATGSGDDELVVEFGLKKEFMLPLAGGKLDPFVGIVGALSELQLGEVGLFQVLFQPTQADWPESIVRSVTHADGKPFFVDAPELAGAAEHKVSKPLYAAVVRVAIKTETQERTLQITRDLAGSLRVFANPQGNELIPLTNGDYPFDDHVEDLLRRQSRRSGMLLNSDELIGFVHLPSSAVRTLALQREMAKAAPAIVQNGGIFVGNNVHSGKTVEVRLSPEQRVRHCHIIGASGTGKSTLLFNLIHQDIENGEGVAVFDPHGDLVDKVLGIIPPERVNDVVLVDPSDEQYSIGFNILSVHSELEKNLLASDLVSVFQRLSTSWGDQMNSVLQNAILAFLESDRRGTLADLRRFLIEPAFRSEFLKSVKDPEIVYYWQKGFPHLTGNRSIGPILTRLETFLSPKPIRYMVSQKENRWISLTSWTAAKSFWRNCPRGYWAKKTHISWGRCSCPSSNRWPWHGRFKRWLSARTTGSMRMSFITTSRPAWRRFFRGARKYRIGLTLAHHELNQLQRNADVASAVMSHPFTRIVFRVGDEDAKKLGDGFSFFEAHDLKNLETGQAIARVERSDFDFNLSVPLPEIMDETATTARRQEVITSSREKYGTARVDIQATLAVVVPHPILEAESLKVVEVPKAMPPPVIKTMPLEVPVPVSVPKPAVIAEEPTTGVPKDLGKGGEQHKAIQKRIKEAAEALGFRSVIEKQIAGCMESIDLFLERDGQNIACEISVSTTIDHELATSGNAFKPACRKSPSSVSVKTGCRKLQRQLRAALEKKWQHG